MMYFMDKVKSSIMMVQNIMVNLLMDCMKEMGN